MAASDELKAAVIRVQAAAAAVIPFVGHDPSADAVMTQATTDLNVVSASLETSTASVKPAA